MCNITSNKNDEIYLIQMFIFTSYTHQILTKVFMWCTSDSNTLVDVTT